MASKTPILIVQGAQYGSEAKGAVAHALCQRLEVNYAVRTGSINAGHSVVLPDGSKVAFQQIPTGSILPWVTPVIGPGAYVHQETLIRELEIANCKDRAVLDVNCGVHLDSYTDEAATAGRNLKIGATGKGCAEAIIHKIADRGKDTPLLLYARWDWLKHPPLRYIDTAAKLTDEYHAGKKILLEGTQGTLLDFHTGPYPFVTSRQTTSAAWVAEAGLSPSLNYEVVLVARTYPIRVAGNSGPMGVETTWPHIARTINRRLAKFGLPALVEEGAIAEFEDCLRVINDTDRKDGMDHNATKLFGATRALEAMSKDGLASVSKLFEITTVTKRLRRVAVLDTNTLSLTVKKEQPAYVVLTFLNYVFPELSPEHNPERRLSEEAAEYVANLAWKIGCPIRYVTLGPKADDMVGVPSQR